MAKIEDDLLTEEVSPPGEREIWKRFVRAENKELVITLFKNLNFGRNLDGPMNEIDGISRDPEPSRRSRQQQGSRRRRL